MNDWMPQWLTERMNDWPCECMKEWMNEWMNDGLLINPLDVTELQQHP